MPIHDWMLVEDGIYHAFHTAWIGAIQRSLNRGVLPQGYYALAEQHAGRILADVLTLQRTPPVEPRVSGGTAIAEKPPRLQRKQKAGQTRLRRSVAIRHVSRHQLVALIELVSPSNKDRGQHVEEFVGKALAALRSGVSLVIVDLFAPGRHDPVGICNVIADAIGSFEETVALPEERPYTVASFLADTDPEMFLEHLALGAPLPDAPLFLNPEHYVDLPLETTYQSAFGDMPAFYQDTLEGREPAN